MDLADDGWLAETDAAVADRGPGSLVIDDLRSEDLEGLDWAGGPLHVRHMAQEIERLSSGEVDYLVVRSPSGRPVAKGGVDHVHPSGFPTIWQLATHGAVQSLGIGGCLIDALEDRVRRRGGRSVRLGVEVDNPRAQRLYERLGYKAVARETAGWEQQDAEGRVYWHETELVVMTKTL